MLIKEKYWNAQESHGDISEALGPVKMKYAYEAQDLVDWSSSAC